jgi:ankyrin repeat protein
MLGASHGRFDTIRLLIEAGADINIQDEDGSTALMCAAEHGHLQIAKYLSAQPDCDVNITDNVITEYQLNFQKAQQQNSQQSILDDD